MTWLEPTLDTWGGKIQRRTTQTCNRGDSFSLKNAFRGISLNCCGTAIKVKQVFVIDKVELIKIHDK
jgi:hypothetical protein